MKKHITLIASFTLVIDQIIKYAFGNLITGFVLIPNFLSFVYAENKGVAFSMLSGNRFFIIGVSLILLFVLITMLKNDLKSNDNKTLLSFSYGLLFGGIFGNLIDRVIRGYVIDYVSLKIFGYYFPIFNLADVAITVGVILLVIYNLKSEIDNKKKKNN